MKKSLILLAMVVMIGFATGCQKEKVLDCSMSQDSTGMKMSQNIKAVFKGNNVKSITLSMDVELEDTYKSYSDTIISGVETQFEDYKDMKGVTFETKKTDDGINVKLEANIDKMDDDSKEALDIVDTKADYDKSKTELEDDGYTCK
jgi:hypothetical protein